MITIENDTRGRIRSKAAEMFMKWGVRSVSMDDIANALGASQKTLYQYFSDTNELTLGEYLYDIYYDTQGYRRRCLRNSFRRLHRLEADPSSDR